MIFLRPVTRDGSSNFLAVTALIGDLYGAPNAVPPVQSIARAVAGNKLPEYPGAPGSAPPAPVAGSKLAWVRPKIRKVMQSFARASVARQSTFRRTML